jgi:hypothetical protein
MSLLASRFGRRLTVGAIAFGPSDEDYSALKALADAPQQYGSAGFFQSIALDVDLLCKSFSALSSTLTATKVELTVLGTSQQRTVRDVRREPPCAVEETVVNNSWRVYEEKDGDVQRTQWNRDRGWQSIRLANAGGAGVGGAMGVAMKALVFGEGAERMVNKFLFVRSTGLDASLARRSWPSKADLSRISTMQTSKSSTRFSARLSSARNNSQ